ncbi:MAG: hypothetical protein IJ484_03285 [Oscillospiraceae bacterium]|nr:hypothetical protein [Oscillospiraceae bacterium]
MEEYRSELDKLHASEQLRRRLQAMAAEEQTQPRPAKRGRRVPFRALTGGLAAAACLMLCVAVWRGGLPEDGAAMQQSVLDSAQPAPAALTDEPVGYALPDAPAVEEPAAWSRAATAQKQFEPEEKVLSDLALPALSDLLALTDGELASLEPPAGGWDAWLDAQAEQAAGDEALLDALEQLRSRLAA